MQEPKILVINFGSTSTKLAYVVGKEFKIRESIGHDVERIKQFKSFDEQYDMRMEAIEGFLTEHGISLDELDAIAPRGGQTEPIPVAPGRSTRPCSPRQRVGLMVTMSATLGPGLATTLHAGATMHA